MDENSDSCWILDTGASCHMSGNINDFVSLAPSKGSIAIAGGQKLAVDEVGTVAIRCRLPDGSEKDAKLTNVLYSTELYNTRLFSWVYVRRHFQIASYNDDLFLLDSKGKDTLWGRHEKDVMRIETVPLNDIPIAEGSLTIMGDSSADDTLTDQPLPLASANFSSFTEFHHAIGHLNIGNPLRLYRDGDLISLKPDDFKCEQCMLSKSKHAKPASRTSPDATKPFDVIHSDLSGAMARPSLSECRYYISFIDEATRFAWIRFLKLKSDATRAIMDFCAYVSRRYGTHIKRFVTDNGGEYANTSLSSYFDQHGILHDPTPPYADEYAGRRG